MVKNLREMSVPEVLMWSNENIRKIMHSKFHQERNPADVLRATIEYNIRGKVIAALRDGEQPTQPQGKLWMAYLVRWAELVSDRYNRRISESEFYQLAAQNRDFLYRNLILLDWATYFEKPKEGLMTVEELYEYYNGKPPLKGYTLEGFTICWIDKQPDDQYVVMIEKPEYDEIPYATMVVTGDEPVARNEAPVIQSPESEYWGGIFAIKAGRRDGGKRNVQSDKEDPANE